MAGQGSICSLSPYPLPPPASRETAESGPQAGAGLSPRCRAERAEPRPRGCSYPASASEGLRPAGAARPGRHRTPEPAPTGLRGKKRRTPPGRPGTEGHLQRLQMRARLGGLNPARGAKLAPAPRPGLLCRCQKVNPPGSPGTLRLAAGPRLTGRVEAEGAGRLPPIHPGHSLYGGRPAPPARCTGRPAPARPIPAARPPPPAPSSTARPGPAPLPAPRPHRPIAPRTFTSRRTLAPGLAGQTPPRPASAGPTLGPRRGSRSSGAAGEGIPGAELPALPALRARTGCLCVHVCIRRLITLLLPRPLPLPECAICYLAIRYPGACAGQPLHPVPARRPCSGFTVRATSRAEFSDGTQVRSRLLDALPCTTEQQLQRMLMTDQLPHAPLRLSAMRRSASLAIPCCFSQDTGAAGCAGNCAARQWLSGDPNATSRSSSSLAATEVHGTITVRWCRVGSLPEMSLSARPRCCKPWTGLHTHFTPRTQVPALLVLAERGSQESRLACPSCPAMVEPGGAVYRCQALTELDVFLYGLIFLRSFPCQPALLLMMPKVTLKLFH